MDGPILTVYKMIQEVETRWASLLALLERLDLLVLCHNQTAGELNRKELIVSVTQHSIIKEMVIVLKPLEGETKFFSTEKVTTISHVWPRLHVLREVLSALELKNDQVKKMRDAICDDLKSRCAETFGNDICSISTSLDPLFRDLSGCSTEEKVGHYQKVKADALERVMKKWRPIESQQGSTQMDDSIGRVGIAKLITKRNISTQTYDQAKEAYKRAIQYTPFQNSWTSIFLSGMWILLNKFSSIYT